MPKTTIELTEAEWNIIKAIWEEEPCTAPDVQERLHKQTGWAYSTVRTLMDRMVAKGLLTSSRLRNLTLYQSAVSRSDAQRGELGYVLKHAFDGALTPMMQCLLDSENLTAKDIAELETLLKARKKQRK